MCFDSPLCSAHSVPPAPLRTGLPSVSTGKLKRPAANPGRFLKVRTGPKRTKKSRADGESAPPPARLSARWTRAGFGAAVLLLLARTPVLAGATTLTRRRHRAVDEV